MNYYQNAGLGVWAAERLTTLGYAGTKLSTWRTTPKGRDWTFGALTNEFGTNIPPLLLKQLQ